MWWSTPRRGNDRRDYGHRYRMTYRDRGDFNSSAVQLECRNIEGHACYRPVTEMVFVTGFSVTRRADFLG